MNESHIEAILAKINYQEQERSLHVKDGTLLMLLTLTIFTEIKFPSPLADYSKSENVR